jgi:hypothetical protein
VGKLKRSQVEALEPSSDKELRMEGEKIEIFSNFVLSSPM